MPKAYSNDLRQKLLEAHRGGEGSLAELAGRFHVSLGWAKKVSAAYSRTGNCERPVRRRGRQSKFSGEMRQQIAQWIAGQPDLTLHELQARLAAELRLKASVGRLWGVLREMGLRRKKNAARG